ncbi:hypothetical protein ON010_g1579 [Phytophthora cinnamomi]|nr:hypothetical protein ON010_g1579 [Phytophthora cinnamomi]
MNSKPKVSNTSNKDVFRTLFWRLHPDTCENPHTGGIERGERHGASGWTQEMALQAPPLDLVDDGGEVATDNEESCDPLDAVTAGPISPTGSPLLLRTLLRLSDTLLSRER